MEKYHALQAKASQRDCNPILTLGGKVSQATTLTVLAVAGVGSGLALGWDSLVALGLSSFVLALLPCAAMCALGICASRMGNKAPGGAADTEAVPPRQAHSSAAAVVADAAANAAENTPGRRAPAP